MEEQAIKLMTILSQAKKHINELESLMSEANDIISTLEQTSVIDERYLLDLSELHLDKSIVTRLRNNANCNTVGDVMKKGRKELLSTINIGGISIQYITEALNRIGICFK